MIVGPSLGRFSNDKITAQCEQCDKYQQELSISDQKKNHFDLSFGRIAQCVSPLKGDPLCDAMEILVVINPKYYDRMA